MIFYVEKADVFGCVHELGYHLILPATIFRTRDLYLHTAQVRILWGFCVHLFIEFLKDKYNREWVVFLFSEMRT